MNIYYQEGGQAEGQEEQLMQLFQAFADIVQDDEFNTAEEVMQMFMELAPEEQEAFVQQAIQIIQQEQGEPEPEEELMEQQEVQPMMQQGGINPQKIQQILQAYASSIGEDPNVIFQQFQQMKPEEQQQALQQIVQQLQGGEQQMKNGGYVNNTGYLEGYESSNNPYNVIPSNKISMRGVRPDIQYIKGTDNLGNTQYMEHGGEYKFDGDFVVEEPVYAQNGTDNDLTKQLQQLEVLLNQKNKDKQLQLQKLNQQKQTLENQRKIREVNFLYDKELKEINNLKQKITLSLPNVLKNPQNYNLDSKLTEFKNTLNYVNKKVKNLDRLNVDNFDVVGKDQQRVYIRPKKESGITLKGVSPGGIPMSIEYSDLPNAENKIPKKLSQYEIDKQTGFVPQQSTLGKQNTTTPANQTTTTGVSSSKATGSGTKTPVINKDKADWTNSWLNSGLLIDLPKDKKDFASVQKAVASFVKERGDDDINLQKNLTDGKFGKTTASITPNPYIAETVPDVLPNDYQIEIPLLNYDNYYIPEEQRQINFTPLQGANYRPNIGVGKQFFKQRGGYNYMQQAGSTVSKLKPVKFKPISFNPRLDSEYDMNIGAETNMKLYENNNSTEQQFDMGKTSPIGNFTQKMFAGRSSDQLLDLGNYANRFGLDNLGLKTTYGDTPVSNANAEKKSKFQQFIDKYGKKAEYSFNNRSSNLASAYNLAKASEPLTSQYRPVVNLKYAETPMLDPLPVVQELYNQQRLATQNVNTNSPTGQAFLSNINSQTQKKTIDMLNDIQQKNAQIAAQNEAGRVNAYNQEQQLNIAANQQYMQAMQQAQAQKDQMMGSALGDLDRMRNSKIKSMNDFNSLAAMTPGMMKTNNPLDLISGRQGFDMDKDYLKLYYAIAQAKTPEEAEALRKAYENKKKQAAEKVVAQTGGKINDFFRNRY